MKKIFFLLIFFALNFNMVFAGQLILISYHNDSDLSDLFQNQNLTIHYKAENFVIATSEGNLKQNYFALDVSAWKNNTDYYIAWFYKEFEKEYVKKIPKMSDILLQEKKYIIIKSQNFQIIPPPIDGNIVKINNSKLKSQIAKFENNKETLLTDPDIVTMMGNVDTVIYLQNLQHLQDYGTRNAYAPESVLAQNWIKSQFESYGYNVELFDFTMPSGPASDNVLATKVGTLYPDEYVLVGAHYDSYSWSGGAPGADDNGTGICGVMEAARVMASYDFDRTIIFCCWSGEEYGLYGSGAYASWAQGQGMDIIAYFNIDMCGYRHPGEPIHTDIMSPASAQPLVDFYTDVCALYLPGFIVEPGSLSGGDSDHTSFNNNGYMGIFPFEDSQNYSPYIHTSNDVIGLSVNSLEMAMTFTQAAVANVASMANYVAPPDNLVAVSGDDFIQLSWDPLVDVDYYNIYRDGILIDNTTDVFYLDENVVNYTTYTYYVTAVFVVSGEETSPSNTVTVTLLPRMSFPFIDDFETGASYWNFEGSWGLSTNSYHSASHSINESPSGNYANDLEINANLYTFSLAYTSEASVSFWSKYDLENNYDYSYFEISTDGNNWTTLSTYNGTQSSWVQESYSLNAYLGENSVSLRFRFYSDYSVTRDGLYIDDFNIDKTTDLNITAFLEGPFQGPSMNTDLNSGNLLPLDQAYNVAPWNYPGGESVTSIPNADVVDWILVEIRGADDPSSSSASSTVERTAAFLLNDGSIVDIDGSSILELHQQIVQDMFVVIRHRNHLDIISSGSPVESDGIFDYDFSSSQNQVYNLGQVSLGGGVWGMRSGDSDANGQIETADKSVFWESQTGTTGYDPADTNLDMNINNQDKNDYWLPNFGEGSNVPE